VLAVGREYVAGRGAAVCWHDAGAAPATPASGAICASTCKEKRGTATRPATRNGSRLGLQFGEAPLVEPTLEG